MLVLLNMQVLTTLTQKGQVTIPKTLRDKFKIGAYDKVQVAEGNGFIKITPTTDILDLAGTFSLPKGKSALGARRILEKTYKRF